MINKELDIELGGLLLRHKEINKSLLAVKYGVDRHTIDRHLKSIENKKERKKRECGLLKYYDLIKEQLMENPSIKATYMYLLNVATYKEIGSYSNFKQYVERHFKEVRIVSREKIVKYRYETAAGDQLQFDWVEDLKLYLKDGTLVPFHLWSATLGFSRRHIFKVVFSLTEATFRKCLIETFVVLGGKTQRVLTDNMSAIVNVKGEEKTIHPSVIQFMKDLDVKLELCQVRHPYTKGKVEVSNKYQDWLDKYNYKFETHEDLIKGIEQILEQSNYQANSETKIAPIKLFQIEKPKLTQLPNKEILLKYHSDFIPLRANNACLIQYEGAKYAVPESYINHIVLLDNSCDKVTLYDSNLNKLAVYPKYTSGIHYSVGLYNICALKNESKEDYEKRVAQNLAALAKLGTNNVGAIVNG